MEKARQRLTPAKRNVVSLSGQQQRSGSTGTGTGGEHVSEYADGPEDPDGSGPAELADVSA